MKTIKYYQIQKILLELVFYDEYKPDKYTAKILKKYYFLGESINKIAYDLKSTPQTMRVKIYSLSKPLLIYYKKIYEK